MNEEEAIAKLKARLDGWQAYLGAENPSVSEAEALPLSLAVITDAAPTANGSSRQERDDALTEAARIAALRASLTQERERSRPYAEAMTREQRIHAVTLAGAPPYSPSGISLGGKDDYPAPAPDREQRKGTVFLTISFLTLAGFCVIFLYVLFGQ